MIWIILGLCAWWGAALVFAASLARAALRWS